MSSDEARDAADGGRGDRARRARPPPICVTPGPGTHILRDVGGVAGLHVMTEAFTEAFETRLWSAGPGGGALPLGATERTGEWAAYDPLGFPLEAYECMNAVEDSGLFAPFCRPDYALLLTYPRGSVFHSHFDSRYRWAETVTGVSLGAPAEMKFSNPYDVARADGAWARAARLRRRRRRRRRARLALRPRRGIRAARRGVAAQPAPCCSTPASLLPRAQSACGCRGARSTS